MSVTAVILDLGSLATAAGVAIATVQIRLSRKQAVTAFEDGLTDHYRTIVAELPVEVFLNTPLEPDILKTHLSPLYRYFDLSNEQTFLRSTGRVSATTWEQWRDGIRKNLERAAFHDAWEQHLDEQTEGDFEELRRLMRDYEIDPIEW